MMKKTLLAYSIFFCLLFVTTESKAIVTPTQGVENQISRSENKKGKAKIERLKKKLSAYMDKKGKAKNDSENDRIDWLASVGLALGIVTTLLIFGPMIYNPLSEIFGFWLISIPIAILGTIFSRIALWKIKKNASEGENRKQKRRAKWGFWLSLSGLIFLALVFILFVIAFSGL